MNGWVTPWLIGLLDAYEDGWLHGWTEMWTDECNEERRDGWINGWMIVSGSRTGWVIRQLYGPRLGGWTLGLLVGWMFGGMNEEASVLLVGGKEVWIPGLMDGEGCRER